MTEFEQKAELFRIYIEQLGYTRLNTGRWIEEVVDDGQGFPKTVYHCPFCNAEGNGTHYCPECGARLKDE